MSASSRPPLPHWYLLGAGNMGTLAAHYLLAAGHRLTVLRRDDNPVLEKTLHQHGQAIALRLPCQPISQLHSPLDYLLVACKTPFTATAMAPLQPWLHRNSRILRFQNGMGALDTLLPQGATLWEAITTSAVKGQHPDHQIVAENHTWWGGSAAPPDWFAALQAHWPGLAWEPALRHRQWQKLVINAVINPLTALHDVANGAIADDPALRVQARQLCLEADQILHAADPHWPGESLPQVLAVARATAANTSSMRADRQRGNPTEIDAITGYLLRLARQYGISAPAHQQLWQQLQS